LGELRSLGHFRYSRAMIRCSCKGVREGANDGFELFRVHAFSVIPCRTTTKLAETEDPPEGGSIQISAALRDVLSESDDVLQSKAIAVDLAVDTDGRTSAIREILLRYAFGATQAPVSAGQELAAALADAMDARSAACLLVIAGYRREDERRVSMWTFPREEAFQFKKSGRAPSIELLQGIRPVEGICRRGCVWGTVAPEVTDGREEIRKPRHRREVGSAAWATVERG
jgi:hypothetical protein